MPGPLSYCRGLVGQKTTTAMKDLGILHSISPNIVKWLKHGLEYCELSSWTENHNRLFRFKLPYTNSSDTWWSKAVCDKQFAKSTLLKEHVALDRSSWSFKSVCNRLL